MVCILKGNNFSLGVLIIHFVFLSGKSHKGVVIVCCVHVHFFPTLSHSNNRLGTVDRFRIGVKESKVHQLRVPLLFVHLVSVSQLARTSSSCYGI